MTSEFETVQRLSTIKRLCKGRKTLHLGCADSPFTETAIANGSLLHFELLDTASELYGFDNDPSALEIIRFHGAKNLVAADLERLSELDFNETFDVIVAGEVIEHLSNPGLFLHGIGRFLRPKGRLVISTVNAYCAFRFAMQAISGRRGRNEPVHPDHTAYYSYKTLRLLVERNGFRVENFLYYDLGAEHRGGVRLIYRTVNDIAVKFFPQFSDGIIAICSLATPAARKLPSNEPVRPEI